MPCRSKTKGPVARQSAKAAPVIAIDGPAGSGKSTVAKAVAERLGFLYLDTGAMYRALTLAVLNRGIDFSNKQALIKLAKEVDIQLKMRGNSLKVNLEGKDVSKTIRKQKITENVCYVAKIAGVRSEMVKLQRGMAKRAKGAVLEGRDIGTIVFPNAKYKFYLDAQLRERVNRRYKELKQMGQEVRLTDTARDINSRDKSDMTRNVAPLTKAKDAVYIDTTNLSVEEVAEKIIQRCSI